MVSTIAPAVPPEPAIPLLLAKLSVPKARGLLVPRHRLFDELGTGVEHTPLTVVCGPAGAGKTSLVASWIAHDLPRGRVAWLSLDSADDEPGTFWSYVVEALSHHQVVAPDRVDRPLHPDAVDRTFLRRLAAVLADSEDTVVLVLDGFEAITDRRVLRELDELLRNAGPELRLLVTTRREPEGPFAAYALTHEASWVRTASLAFTPEETRALLRQHDVAVDDEQLELLQHHTEGWAAGLRLSAAAMQRGISPASYLADLPWRRDGLAGYLVEEVLEAQTASVRDFLLLTGVVDRLTPDLAEALTGRADSSAVLLDLTREHALVSAVDEPPTIFRYHPLLASVLRTELTARRPGVVADQHARAARWFAEHGDFVQAAVHHGAAGDMEAACADVAHRLGTVVILEGRAPAELLTVLRTTSHGATGAASHAIAAALAVVALDLDTAEARLADATAAVERAPSEERSRLRAGIALVDVVVARRQLDQDRARRACERLDRELERLPPLGYPTAQTRALALASLSGTQLWCGDFTTAEEGLRAAFVASRAPGCELSQMAVLGHMALWAHRAGRLRDAEEFGNESLRLARELALAAPYRTGVGHLALALVAIDRNDGAAARRHLAATDLTAEALTDRALGAVAGMLRAFRMSLDGQRSASLEVLADIRSRADGLPPWMGSRIRVAESAVRLRCGDIPGAASALAGATVPDAEWQLARASVSLAGGDTRGAERMLAPLLVAPKDLGALAVDVQLLGARLAGERGDVSTARRLVLAAVDASLPDGRRRPFLEHWAWLDQLAGQHPDLRRALAWVRGPALPRQRDPVDDVVAVLIEPLSGREVDVLARMARAMSVADIAADLHVSVNTVKSHQKNLFRKLSVHRASDAVQRGRSLQLV